MSDDDHENPDGHRRAAAWLAAAASRNVVRRAVSYAFGVGALLIAINHGDAILAGRVDAARVLRMALTVLVPYCVSTASSVGALLASRRCDDAAPHEPRGQSTLQLPRVSRARRPRSSPSERGAR